MNSIDNRLQKKLLDMFCWFHQFCEENSLRYYMLGGTMLGAVRHQGFIPWDDDIDVGMPREDYRRLEQLLSHSAGKYVLETPQTENTDFYYPFAKLYDTETTLVENTRYKIKRGIYLDIFPLDGAGNSEAEGLSEFKRIKVYRMTLLTLTTGYRPGRRRIKNFAVATMRVIPKWLLDPQKLLLHLDALCARKDFDSCEWVVNYLGNWQEKEMMPRAFFGEPAKYVFEGFEVWGPADYEGYLSSLYGDWRKLPPVEKQKSHHDFLFMDLENSYLKR